MKKIIAFAGSNSSVSINKKLLNLVIPTFTNTEVELLDLRDFKVDVYSPDDEKESGFPAKIQELFAKMTEADGFLISVPEHNGSMPAVFKNTLDWLSRMGRKVFNQKPTVLLSATPGGRAGAGVLGHIESIMPHQGAEVVALYGVGNFHSKWEEGVFNDKKDLDVLKDIVQKLEAAL